MNRILAAALSIVRRENSKREREERLRSIAAERATVPFERDPEALARLELVQVGALCFHRALRRPGRPVLVIDA